jgi:hypothetical protein
MKLNLLKLIIPALFIISCKKEDTSNDAISYSRNGVFVVNEGSFGNGNASITYLKNDFSYSIPDVFNSVNQIPLGDVAQSMNIFNDKGFIVVNNSQKVMVVDMINFKKSQIITGFSSPRFFLGITSTKGYVSDWTANNIKIIDLNTYTITGTIPCNNGPEQMLVVNDKVFVCNVGGFGNDSSITVIDTNSDLVIKTLQVGVNPNSIKLDETGKIWVLCGGTLGDDFTPGTADDIGGSLLQIDPANYNIIKRFDFQSDGHPVKLISNGLKNKLFFLGGNSAFTGKVYSMNTNANALPTTPIIAREFYGLGYNPENKKIYCGLPVFSLDTYMIRYNENGSIVDSAKVGIAPNSFTFN